jgi:putative phosphonate metabolism protein
LNSTPPRYAIYFVPAAESALYRFGATALGYDCYTGADVATFDAPPVDIERWLKVTEEPRRYGFHATFKAPFDLADGRSEAELVGEFKTFARTLDTVPLITPVVELLARFVAIGPAYVDGALGRLAASCVTHFDGFRAPLTEAERRRRMAARLSAVQIAYVDRWGYPYVFDEFRFHMTLTGALAPDVQPLLLAYLRRAFERAVGERPILVNRLALLRQAYVGARFVVITEASFGQG